MIETKVYSVLELNRAVRNLIKSEFPDHIWIYGEIQDLRDRGTINLSLVQKDPDSDQIVAQLKAVIFVNNRPKIDRRIAAAGSGFELKKDIEVKLLAKVDLYPKNGQFSLTVVDIEPEYTLGKVAMARERILNELKKQGLIERNKLVALPQVPLRIGLITSGASAAYHDFINEITASGYGFKVLLRDCFMQGEKTEGDVVGALKYFNHHADDLGLIVITRGGGSTADLGWFDNKAIAETVARSSLPVITALGHQINTTITDIIAHTCLKTPTKAAQFIVERVGEFITELTDIGQRLIDHSQELVKIRRQELEARAVKLEADVSRYFRFHCEELIKFKGRIASCAQRIVDGRNYYLKQSRESITVGADRAISRLTQDLAHCQDQVRLLDPKKVLKRGYSLTIKGKKTIRSIKDIERDDQIMTVVYDGRIASRVQSKEKTDE